MSTPSNPPAPHLPSIHKNGTAKASLIEQLMEAKQAVVMAIEALNQACPNQRDFYMRPDEHWELALSVFRGRKTALIAVRNDLDADMEAIDKMEVL